MDLDGPNVYIRRRVLIRRQFETRGESVIASLNVIQIKVKWGKENAHEMIISYV
jgi:hypothetical protein